MIEWFCSGKIYTANINGKGHTQTGYFSTVANSDNNIKASEARDSITEAVAKEYDVQESEVHIEQLYKV